MAGDTASGLGAAATLVVGGFGAIAAIYLKEAAQAAMQRRVIAWQLFGYLMSWRSQIVRNGHFVMIYEGVKARNLALTSAMPKGSAEVRRLLEEQSKERAELREQIKTVVKEALEKDNGAVLETAALKFYSSEASIFAVEWRKQLVDSKSFISDRDAALLGKAAAMNVIQFRSNMLSLSNTFESALKLLHAEADNKPEAIASLVDAMVVSGEDALTAFIRLEGNVDAISAKSPTTLTIDILMGK